MVTEWVDGRCEVGRVFANGAAFIGAKCDAARLEERTVNVAFGSSRRRVGSCVMLFRCLCLQRVTTMLAEWLGNRRQRCWLIHRVGVCAVDRRRAAQVAWQSRGLLIKWSGDFNGWCGGECVA